MNFFSFDHSTNLHSVKYCAFLGLENLRMNSLALSRQARVWNTWKNIGSLRQYSAFILLPYAGEIADVNWSF